MAATIPDRLSNATSTIAGGIRLYRRTPSGLRRPEPASRLAATAFTLWFGGMFAALGVLTTRTTPPSQTLAGVIVHGYFAAALIGVIGLGLLLTRRYRVGIRCLAAMLVVGQAVSIAAIL